MTIVLMGCILAASALGAHRPVSQRQTDVAVIYFPGYHRDTHYDAWFGALVAKALEQVESARLRPPAILINAWNEWTEGSVLLPDVQYKTQFLEELRKALNQK